MATRRSRLQVRPNTGSRAFRDANNSSQKASTVPSAIPEAKPAASNDIDINNYKNDVSKENSSKLNKLSNCSSVQNGEVSSEKICDSVNLEEINNSINNSNSASSNDVNSRIIESNECIKDDFEQLVSNKKTASLNKNCVPNLNLAAESNILAVELGASNHSENIKDNALNNNATSERTLDTEIDHETREKNNSDVNSIHTVVEVNTEKVSDNGNGNEQCSIVEETNVNEKEGEKHSETNSLTTSSLALKETDGNTTNKHQDGKKKTTKPSIRSSLPKVQPNVRDSGRRRNRQQVNSSNDNEESRKSQNPPSDINRALASVEEEPASIHDVPEVSVVAETLHPVSGGSKQITHPQSPIKAPEKKTANKPNENNEVLAQKRRHYKRGLTPPERKNMTMLDLIYWNPPNNPMKSSSDTNITQVVPDEVDHQAPSAEEESVDNPSTTENLEEPEVPCPQLMVGPNGEITLDENSLVIHRAEPESLSSQDVVCEVPETTYASFRKSSAKKGWSDKETAKFYKALSVVGTDFSLMLNLFPQRSRQELKNKFKREERYNRGLVDKAINDPQQFDLTGFEDDNTEDDPVIAKPKRRPYKRKPKQPEISNEAANDENGKNDNEFIAPRRKKRQKKKLSENSIEGNDHTASNGLEHNEGEDLPNTQQKRQPRKRKPKQKEYPGEVEIVEGNERDEELVPPRGKKRRVVNKPQPTKQRRKQKPCKPKGIVQTSDYKDIESDDELERIEKYLNELRGRRKKKTDDCPEQLEIQDLSGHVDMPPCNDSSEYVEIIPTDFVFNLKDFRKDGNENKEQGAVQNESTNQNGNQTINLPNHCLEQMSEAPSTSGRRDQSILETSAISILNASNSQALTIPLSPAFEGNEAAEQLVLLASRTPTHEQVVHVYLVSSPPHYSSGIQTSPASIINAAVEKHTATILSTSLNKDSESELPNDIIRLNSTNSPS